MARGLGDLIDEQQRWREERERKQFGAQYFENRAQSASYMSRIELFMASLGGRPVRGDAYAVVQA